MNENVLGTIHGSYVHQRRVRVLSTAVADLLPRDAHLLDVGCGDGALSGLIMEKRSDVRIFGLDILIRPNALIPVTGFDGQVLPYADASFDVVMFMDVLHHAADPMILLREATRVARQRILIKDHNRDAFLGESTLRFMDWIGNARHGVALPYNYWTRQRWNDAFLALDLKPTVNRTALSLYPPAVDWIFGRDLHFLSCLEKRPDARWDLAKAA
jgi:SAM-dependent methyltransferase